MSQYEQIRQTQKKYCSLAMTIAIFVGLALILFSLRSLGKGLILGTLFSVFNFILMGEALPKRLGLTRKRATLVSGISVLSRYALLAIPIVAAIKTPQFDLVATVIGLFMVQITLLGEQIGHLIFSSTRNKLDY